MQPVTAAALSDEEMKYREERRKNITLYLEFVKLLISASAVVGVAIAVIQWKNQNKILNEQYEIAKENIDQRLVTEWKEHIALLIREPALRPYFYEGKNSGFRGDKLKAGDDETLNKVLIYADLRLELIDNVWGTSHDTWGDDNVDTWKNTFLQSFRDSEVLCRRLKERLEQFDYISYTVDAVKEAGKSEPADNSLLRVANACNSPVQKEEPRAPR